MYYSYLGLILLLIANYVNVTKRKNKS